MKVIIKINNFCEKYLSIKFVRLNRSNQTKFLIYEDDLDFKKLYYDGLNKSGTPDGGLKRFERFYNLVQMLRLVINLKGSIAECGSWKGLSSLLLCHQIKKSSSDFKGEHYIIFDSFEGLSSPGLEDMDQRQVNEGWPKQPNAGAYAAPIDIVKNTLKDFPKIKYYEGWIPTVYEKVPPFSYKFIHIDLDLYEPIISSLRFFWPQMVNGGMIIIDDYGSLHWPGAKRAVEEFSKEFNVPFVGMVTGQAFFIKM